MKHLLLTAMLALTVFAGCLDDESATDGVVDEPVVYSWGPPVRHALPDDPMPEGARHDHGDASQHRFLWNYDVSSHDPILGNAVNMAGMHAMDVQAGHLFGAIYGSHTASVDGGLVIWDLADPAQPVQTGRWIVPGSVGGDRSIGATNEGDFVVLSTEPITCFTQAGANALTIYLIDTSNKAVPVVADFITVSGQSLGSPIPGGPSLGAHAVWVEEIDGEDYAFLSGSIYRIDRTEDGGRLVSMGTSVPIGHDMYVRHTPYNKTLGLAAGGSLRVHDLTDPAAPALLARWTIPEGAWFSDFDYYVHTADIVFFEDQDLIIVTTEDWLDWTSQMFVVDATPLRDFELGADGEPLQLEMIGRWANPGNHTASGLSFSLHNPRFSPDGILSVSSYHGGLWQLDMRHPDFRVAPAEIAYAVYAAEDGPLVMDPVQGVDFCNLGYQVDAPTYMDVGLGPDGILYAADVYTGLYTFTPTTSHPVYGTS